MHSLCNAQCVKGQFLSKNWIWSVYFDFRILARKFKSINQQYFTKDKFFEHTFVICRSVLCMWVERAEHFVSRKRQLTAERGRMYLCLLHRKKWIEFYYEYARGKKTYKRRNRNLCWLSARLERILKEIQTEGIPSPLLHDESCQIPGSVRPWVRSVLGNPIGIWWEDDKVRLILS